MSWSSRRQTTIVLGFTLLFGTIIAVPTFIWLYEPATCFDGKQNQGESAPDRSGPCVLLDERTLIPHAIQWARSFQVRDGSWSAVAYIENPNGEAGVRAVPYRFKFYDDKNILVAEREGTTYIMPGSVTPVYEGEIETGNRLVGRTYFEFAAPLVWERMSDTARVIVVTGKSLEGADTMPRLSASAENTSVSDAQDIQFVAVVFGPGGNAIGASRTVIPKLIAGAREDLVFTWPDPFTPPVGPLDVIPLRRPELTTSRDGFF